MNRPDLSFVIDVGTGSVRCALVDDTGRIVAIRAREYEQIVPQYGWSEQRPADWWDGVVHTARELLEAEPGAAERLIGVVATGQMHGTVLIDAEGEPVRDSVPLWNDKRTAELVAAFEREHDIDAVMQCVANPPTPAWQGFKLQWFARHEPEVLARSATLLMPKDYINYRLTGVRATDWTEASASFLMDSATRSWSHDVAALLGVPADILPPIRSPLDVLGQVTKEAALATGLPAGLPVAAGAADFPAALLGSGVHSPGAGSDVTGTSTIVTVHGEHPVLDSRVSNVATVDGGWGAFALLDSGGDAVRWARRAFHDNELSYEQVTRRAAAAPAGSRGLFFLPYLTGERLGARRNSRAGFFGLTAEHGLAHLHRAILEGVAFAAAGNVGLMRRGDTGLKQMTAAGGGAKSDLWLQIKASAYGCPIRVPESPECSVIGSTAILAAALGRHETPASAAEAFVHFAHVVEPDPVWAERYERMRGVFDQLRDAGGPFYDMLDALDETVLESDSGRGAGHA
ncbi:xylulokinase [Salinisphaera sp.]|uniref:xylulokinase n=1 Tax=Salinisphaera sp. TaxID=1914330 RepID=UPI002D780B13|nr:FGGY family carbohydrate kinase [Salinisphaera sp.]HET7313088.1 FGGY family carbohydrate kinase [Salinisphaera sp.]